MLALTDVKCRQAIEALWQIDAAMERIVASSTEAAIGKVKLAWWRERLRELDRGIVSAEPRLQAVAEHLLPRGVTGDALAGIEPGWSALLDDPPEPRLVAERGAYLFTTAAGLAGSVPDRIGEVGALWALGTAAQYGGDPLTGLADYHAERLRGVRFPLRLRALTMLGRVVADNLERGATKLPSRARLAFSSISHLWTGRIL